MDTPQVTAALLDSDWEGADAVLGLSEDGGFWAIGLRSGDPRSIFAGIPMSTDRTGAAQLARLAALGLSVRLLPPLRDVDLPADAEPGRRPVPLARLLPPSSRSARRPGGADGRAALRPRRSPAPRREVTSSVDALDLDVARWSGDADAVDLMVVSRCEPPVLDLGCGPGRMVVALNRSGRSGPRGGHLGRCRRDQHEPGWTGSASADQRLAAGRRPLGHRTAGRQQRRDGRRPRGPAPPLLRPGRARRPGHLPKSTRARTGTRCTRSSCPADGRRSLPLPWGRIGARTLTRVASALDLLVAEEWSAGGRVFVSLRKN